MDAKDVKIEIPAIEPGGALRIMMDRQQSLYADYQRIEKLPEYPWDLRLKENQILFKGFLFRVIEEMGEAYESFLEGDMTNFYTELADACHFLLEAWIVAGIEAPQMYWEAIWSSRNKGRYNLDNQALTNWFWQTTFRLDLVSNALRNKQWKQTHVLPDMHMFNRLMKDAFITFFTGFMTVGISEAAVLEWYIRKNEVNKFRIRSKY